MCIRDRSFLALSAFLQGTMTARLCLWLAVGTVGCVLLECLCQNIADRLQSAAGYMVFADLRMELGRHLLSLIHIFSFNAVRLC